jgi:hypothetical protein
VPKDVHSCLGGVPCAQEVGCGRPFPPHRVRFYDLSKFVLGSLFSRLLLSKPQGGS